MARNNLRDLSRRERQIMEALYRRGRATVAEVREDLPDPPTDAAVRAALLLLEDKGHVRGSMRGQRSVYTPAVGPTTARRRALRDLVTTFFRGSRADVMAELLSEVADQELDRIEELLRRRRAEDRGR